MTITPLENLPQFLNILKTNSYPLNRLLPPSSIEMNKQEKLEKIRHYVSQGFFKQALYEFRGTFWEDKATILLEEINDLERRESEDILSHREYILERNLFWGGIKQLIEDFRGKESSMELNKQGDLEKIRHYVSQGFFKQALYEFRGTFWKRKQLFCWGSLMTWNVGYIPLTYLIGNTY